MEMGRPAPRVPPPETMPEGASDVKLSLKLSVVTAAVLTAALGAMVFALTTPILGDPGRLTAMRAGLILLVLLAGVAGFSWAVGSATLPIDRFAAHLKDLADEDSPSLPPVESKGKRASLDTNLAKVLRNADERTRRVQLDNDRMKVQLRVGESEKRQREAILNSLTDPVLVTNAFDEVVLANQAARELLGFQFEPGTRPKLASVVHDPHLARFLGETRPRAGSAARRTEEIVITVHGTARTFRATASPVIDEEQKVAAAAVVLRDTTGDMQVEKTKSEFISAVSHELKTPLTSIKAYVEMLMDGEAEDPATQQEFFEIIDRQADRMSRLVSNLLDLGRIETGVVKIDKQPLSLNDVVEKVVQMMRPSADEKRIEFVCDVSTLYMSVNADSDTLSRAVMNLVSNAIKYTPEGGHVQVRTQMVEDRAVCEVRDTGLGIGPKELKRVFDKFYRVPANKKAAPGTGLGLPLVKSIVEEIHDGTVEVESTPGEGSLFRMTLPLAGPAPGSSVQAS